MALQFLALSLWLSARGQEPSDHALGSMTSRFVLPAALGEVSGLATVDSNTVLAVGDEIATVYRINLDGKKAELFFTLGTPAIKGDFEGITIASDDVWLVTSQGTPDDNLSSIRRPEFQRATSQCSRPEVSLIVCIRLHADRVNPA